VQKNGVGSRDCTRRKEIKDSAASNAEQAIEQVNKSTGASRGDPQRPESKRTENVFKPGKEKRGQTWRSGGRAVEILFKDWEGGNDRPLLLRRRVGLSQEKGGRKGNGGKKNGGLERGKYTTITFSRRNKKLLLLRTG